MIVDFKSSEAYEFKLNKKNIEIFDKDGVHMIRQLHHKFKDKEFLFKCFYNDAYAEECRQGANFVPYKDEKLLDIQVKDVARSLPKQVPPPSLHPSLWDYINMIPPTPNVFMGGEEGGDGEEEGGEEVFEVQQGKGTSSVPEAKAQNNQDPPIPLALYALESSSSPLGETTPTPTPDDPNLL